MGKALVSDSSAENQTAPNVDNHPKPIGCADPQRGENNWEEYRCPLEEICPSTTQSSYALEATVIHHRSCRQSMPPQVLLGLQDLFDDSSTLRPSSSANDYQPITEPQGEAVGVLTTRKRDRVWAKWFRFKTRIQKRNAGGKHQRLPDTPESV